MDFCPHLDAAFPVLALAKTEDCGKGPFLNLKLDNEIYLSFTLFI